jgi:hypothetical protein
MVFHDGIAFSRPAENKDDCEEDTNANAHGHALMNYFVYRIMLSSAAVLVL